MDGRRHWSWGTGLASAIIVFMGCILVMVFISMSQGVSLVTDHYYDKELRYEDRISAMKRANALTERVTILEHAGTLQVRFPRSGAPDDVEGRITLYRPADSSEDRTRALALDSAYVQEISLRALPAGFWRVQLQWRMRGEDYYLEQPVVLQ